MNTKLMIGTIFAILILLLAGCSAPMCYPPNKIIGSSCCLDDNDDGVCDLDEQEAEEVEEIETEEIKEEPSAEEAMLETPEKETEEVTEEMPEAEETTKIDPTKVGLQLGKQEMKFGESKNQIEINKLLAYRSSRDKGIFDYMIYTVRNTGDTELESEVELFFEDARVGEYNKRIKKEYNIPTLKPGEKIVIKQSLGIRFEGIDKTRDMTLTLYKKFTAPREDLGSLKKTLIPTDYMDNLEIYTYGLPEY